MKIVFTITLVLAIIISAGIGCAAIFGLITMEEAKDAGVSALAAILVLGISCMLVAMLTRVKPPKE